ncbi:MAG: 4-(cytidine 5'-diphospho)-2-C-methyl-D-erythritol kinase [Planctomycetes bacterium]|nr:4-(cytidine 5'-diphospho)-2-C-methyl-D-erythritol kinase [Planctomycetota bacterium]
MRIQPIPGGLRVLAPAKVNLYLEVGPRRADGYHDLDSLFQAIDLHDELEVLGAPEGTLELEEAGIAEGERNLVVRAARRLLESGLVPPGRRPGARLRLKKRIPEGAGLGGGSSDAAAALVGLARLWRLAASRRELLPLAASLGSDVPFFLSGGTARCRGRGELVESWSHAFPAGAPFHYVLVYPRIKVSTKRAYEALDASRGSADALTAPSPLDSMPPVAVRTELGRGHLFFNRFETVVCSAFPELRRLHETLCKEAFVKVLMSGSGSTIYGLARSAEEARRIAGKLRTQLEADVFLARSEPPGDEENAGQGGLVEDGILDWDP